MQPAVGQQPTVAQQTADAGDGLALQEIIVTAQRRQQNQQDVPVSLTAFSGDNLAQLGVQGAAQYLAMTPNVGFSEDSSTGSRGVNVSIRGVSDLKTGQNSVIPSIGEYIDGFSVSAGAAGFFNPQMADIDQVEVLRGPQGTYFGRNSLGGALNITTKKPTNDFGGYVTGGFTDYNGPGIEETGTAVVNVPLIDGRLKTRNVFYYEDSTGIVRNINPAGVDSGHMYWMERNSLEWNISDRATLSTMVMYDHYNQNGDETVPSGVWSLDSVDGYSLGVTNLTHAVNQGTNFWPSNTTLKDTSGPEMTNDRELTAVANFAYQFNDAVALKAVTGLLQSKLNRYIDEDGVGGWDSFYETNYDYGTSASGEVRLEVNTKPVTWVLGTLYATDRSSLNPHVLAGDNTADPLTETGPGPGGAVLLPPLPSGLCFECETKHFVDKSSAVFTEVTWQMIDELQLIAGGRYTHDQVDTSLQTFGPIFPTAFESEKYAYGGVSSNDFAPKVGLVYKPIDPVHLYATVSKGYKAGGSSLGFNPSPTTVPLPAVIDQPFRPEKLWSYELGLKSEWFDRRLRVNASVFYSHWTDLQLEVFRFLVPGDLSSKFALTTNFPSAQAEGAELEVAAAITHGFSLTGNAGYLNSRILDSGIQQLSGGFLVNLAGLPMPNSPRFTVNLGAEEHWSLASGEAWVRAENVYRGSQFSNVEALAYQQIRGEYLPTHAGDSAYLPPAGENGFPFRTPSYDVVNLGGGYNWGQFESLLSVQNLFGKIYYTGTAESYSLEGIRLKPHPRAVMLSLTYKFGK